MKFTKKVEFPSLLCWYAFSTPNIGG